MKKSKFQIFKDEIIKRAKGQNACIEQFKRAVAAKDFPELFTVIKDNFNWSVNQKIIDVDLLMTVRDEARKSDLWVNETTKSGYLLAWGNATVGAEGNATVRAGDNATVRAWGNATVEACDNATVEAEDNATVRAGDNATVEAGDNATVEAGGNATVRAGDNAFVSSWKNIECKLSDHAIFRNTETKEITINKGSYTVILK